MNLYYIFHIPKDTKRGEHVKQDEKTKVHEQNEKLILLRIIEQSKLSGGHWAAGD